MAKPMLSAYADTELATTPVGRQLIAAGVVPFLLSVEIEPTCVRGWSYPGLLQHLRQHEAFTEGALHGLHPEVGEDRTDFRAWRRAFGSGSLQIVIDTRTGRYYADIDQWNPYEDVVNWVGHAGEVLRGWWRKVRG